METQLSTQFDLDNINKDTSDLYIKGSEIRDFSILINLKKLTKLELLSTKYFDFSLIENMKNLTSLRLNGITTITNLDFLKSLTNLTELILETPASWDGSGKTVVYNSLSSLSKCEKLKSIKMFDIQFLEDGLKPLYGIKSLKEIVTRNTFLTYEFAKLELNRPDIVCKYAKPYFQHHLEFYKCKKCNEFKIEFSGVDLKRRVFCKKCNLKKIEELTKRYYEIQISE
ncbi:MAG: hypothetical protein ACK46Y_17315 [Fluviicola sp.]|jgi:hypothetical protein